MTRMLSREGAVWLAVAAVIGFCGWYKNINVLLLMAYVMASMIAVNYWFARRQVGRVSARRLATPPAFAGETFTHSAEIANPSLSTVTCFVQSQAERRLAHWFVPQLPPGESRTLVAEWRFDRRGVYDVPPLAVKSGDPFGLIRYRDERGDPARVVILPAVGQVDLGGLRRWLIRTGAGDARVRRPVRRPGLDHADVRGIRPYRPGDSIRDIHWRTSARRDELVVRDYDATEPLDLILVLDAWLPAAATEPARERLEWAIAAAASVCWAWATTGETATVTLVVPNGSPAVQTVAASRRAMRPALAPLAALAGCEEMPPFPPGAFRTRTNRCVRLLVSSRQQSPILGDLRRAAGVPFVTFDPTMEPSWYRPPIAWGGADAD